MKIRYLILICLIPLLGLALWRVVMNHCVEVRNSSGVLVKNLALELHHGDWRLRKEVAALQSGESVRVRHSQNDTAGHLSFEMGGKQFKHSEPIIDLWTGEGLRLDIQPDGTVKSESEGSQTK